MQEKRGPGNTRGWDTYWQGATESDAYVSGGVSHPAVAEFWDAAFAELLAEREHTRVLDIATGSGAVVERLFLNDSAKQFDVTCVDISGAAVDNVRERFPGITGVVADANDIPLDSGSFDLITSQFGIEYAGPRAFDEATRLLADSGTLVFLVHIRPGIIFDECSAAKSAVERTAKSSFVSHARRFFEAGFAAVRGADRTSYERAGREFSSSIQEVEAILAQYGEHVAGDTIVRLYSDVQKIHSRIQHYDPKEVLSWLRSMETEIAQYGERMSSMCDAAFSRQHLDDVCERLRERGLEIGWAESFGPKDSRLPLAWVLQASRGARKDTT